MIINWIIDILFNILEFLIRLLKGRNITWYNRELGKEILDTIVKNEITRLYHIYKKEKIVYCITLNCIEKNGIFILTEGHTMPIFLTEEKTKNIFNVFSKEIKSTLKGLD